MAQLSTSIPVGRSKHTKQYSSEFPKTEEEQEILVVGKHEYLETPLEGVKSGETFTDLCRKIVIDKEANESHVFMNIETTLTEIITSDSKALIEKTSNEACTSDSPAIIEDVTALFIQKNLTMIQQMMMTLIVHHKKKQDLLVSTFTRSLDCQSLTHWAVE